MSLIKKFYFIFIIIITIMSIQQKQPIICNICNSTFNQNQNLNKHLIEKKCKSELLTDLVKLNKYLEEQKQKIMSQDLIIHGDYNTLTNCNNTFNMNIEIQINPIHKLDLSYIDTLKMKELIEIYDENRFKFGSTKNQEKNPERINITLGDYVKEIMVNKSHPENHAVKYIRKDPPTFNSVTEDKDGKTVNVVKGLKDTCELLSDPILNQLKLKIKEFVQKYKKDDDFDILYEDAIKELKKELNKTTVKKALSSVLKNDILNDIEMKLHVK